MSFDSLWLSLIQKKPLLADEDSTVKINSGNLKKILRQFYDAGTKQLFDGPGAKDSLFDKIFGSRCQ